MRNATIQQTRRDMRATTSQKQQLCSVPGRKCMCDQSGACTTQGGVPEQKLETFSWQLTMPPASRPNHMFFRHTCTNHVASHVFCWTPWFFFKAQIHFPFHNAVSIESWEKTTKKQIPAQPRIIPLSSKSMWVSFVLLIFCERHFQQYKREEDESSANTSSRQCSHHVQHCVQQHVLLRGVGPECRTQFHTQTVKSFCDMEYAPICLYRRNTRARRSGTCFQKTSTGKKTTTLCFFVTSLLQCNSNLRRAISSWTECTSFSKKHVNIRSHIHLWNQKLACKLKIWTANLKKTCSLVDQHDVFPVTSIPAPRQHVMPSFIRPAQLGEIVSSRGKFWVKKKSKYLPAWNLTNLARFYWWTAWCSCGDSHIINSISTTSLCTMLVRTATRQPQKWTQTQNLACFCKINWVIGNHKSFCFNAAAAPKCIEFIGAHLNYTRKKDFHLERG